MTKTKAVLFLIFLLLFLTSNNVLAHSGRTDANGGHNCYVGSCAGTYHYHNGGDGGGSSGGLSEAAQARIAGADFARTENRATIESSASVEGTQQGNSDGLAGTSVPYGKNDSIEHCSQEVTFTNAVSAIYKEAFQSLYTTTCIHVYDDAYRAAYQTANLSSRTTFEENQAKALAAKEEEDVNSSDSWLGWLILGGFIGLPLIGAGWESIRKYFE